jgi:hypothetical protein
MNFDQAAAGLPHCCPLGGGTSREYRREKAGVARGVWALVLKKGRFYRQIRHFPTCVEVPAPFNLHLHNAGPKLRCTVL